MLTIRFSRIGKKNKPVYRIIISEKSKDPYGRALEILGFYNPHTKELKTKAERIKYWVSKGSSISPSVNNLLIEKNIIEGEKLKASKARKKKKGESSDEGAEKSVKEEKVEGKTTDNKKEEAKKDSENKGEDKQEEKEENENQKFQKSGEEKKG